MTSRLHFPSISRRLITVLFIGQGMALVALFTSTTISSITGVQLAGTERVAGWPSTAQLVGGTVGGLPRRPRHERALDGASACHWVMRWASWAAWSRGWA